MHDAANSIVVGPGGGARLIGEVPKLDRFFPNCLFGLVEWYSRLTFGLPDLKKCWFANTFMYERRFLQGWLAPDGVALDGRMEVAPDTRSRCRERLVQIYGISLTEQVFHSFDALLAFIVDALARGRPAITSYDMALIQGPERSGGAFHPHMVGIVGYEPTPEQLWLVEQVKGQLSIDLNNYRASFDNYVNHGRPFLAVECQRSRPLDRPLDPSAVLSDLDACIANLFSTNPAEGLLALDILYSDVRQAQEDLGVPFSIPGLWLFSHDRYCLAQALSHWEEARIGTASSRAELDQILRQCFELWFGIDMKIESALAERSADGMAEVPAMLKAVIGMEHELARVLERISRMQRSRLSR